MPASIIARLGLDSRDFREGIATAQKSLAGLTAGSLTNVAGTLISGAAIKSVTEYASRVQDLSDRYNINAVALQRVGNVYEKEGGSLDAAAGILKKLILNSDRARNGNGELERSFLNLGITVDDLRQLAPEEILKKIGSSSMNAADLVKVLGKNALDIRPTLKKLADGTAEFGRAIDSIDIKKLDEADDKLKALGQDARVLGAGIAVQIGEGFHLLANDARNLSEDAKNAWLSATNAIAAASKGKFGATFVELGHLSEAYKQQLKDLFFYREHGEQSGARVEGRAGGPAAARAKTPAQEKADQKERERLQFSLETLAEQTPDDIERRNNIQATYAGQQAREVQRLEAQARREAFLYGAQDPNAGRATLDRADALRQSIGGLTESDKQVGAFKQALDSSNMAQDIATIAAETVAE